MLRTCTNTPHMIKKRWAAILLKTDWSWCIFLEDTNNALKNLQVILPFGLQREVDAYLNAYLSKKSMKRGNFSANSLSSLSGGNMAMNEGFCEQPEPLLRNNVVMEKIISRKSLQLRNKQQEWQVHFILTSSMKIFFVVDFLSHLCMFASVLC